MLCFDFEEERLKKTIINLKAKRVLIQLPEGIKFEAINLAEMIKKTGALPIISADPCYGACDLVISEAESLDVNLIIHFGHSKFFRHSRVPTIYVEARAKVKVDSNIKKALPVLEKWRRIGLTTTVQHIKTLDVVRKILLDAGKIVVIGDAEHLSYPGQVIGCDYSNVKSIEKDVEAFLFIGGGKFHPLGVALSTSKPIVVVDPYEEKVFSVEQEAKKVIKQRWMSIEEAKAATIFAVLVGLRIGQQRLDDALKLKNKLEDNGKIAYIFAAKEITPEALIAFSNVEAYVNTACPRISIDDASKFQKPVLTVDETLVVVGELSWEELCRKGWFEN
jgi:2-(3-amino-3-carboxypropyl)histidine synthase